MSVNTSCALEGGDCLAALIDDTTAIYVEDTTPSDETDYQTRFIFDPNDLSMGGGEELDIFQALDDTVVAFQVQLKENGASYDIRLQVNDDNPSPQTTTWYTVTDAPHDIVVEWWASSSSGADDGTARLWIDGELKETLTDIDNDTHQVDKARLGAVAGIDAGTSGTMYFDNYASWTEAEGIVYDGSGARVKTLIDDVTTVYVGGFYEKDITNSVERTYYSGAMRVDDGTNDDVYWVLSDQLGSTSVIANTNTTQHSENRYKAWGETRYSNGTLPTTTLYTGQREESDIGLYFYKARWYDPALGRFIQADSVVPSLRNPQAYDRYHYANSNPLRYTDPTGHFSDEQLAELFHLNPDDLIDWLATLDAIVVKVLRTAELGDIFAYQLNGEPGYYMFVMTTGGALALYPIGGGKSWVLQGVISRLTYLINHSEGYALFIPKNREDLQDYTIYTDISAGVPIGEPTLEEGWNINGNEEIVMVTIDFDFVKWLWETVKDGVGVIGGLAICLGTYGIGCIIAIGAAWDFLVSFIDMPGTKIPVLVDITDYGD